MSLIVWCVTKARLPNKWHSSSSARHHFQSSSPPTTRYNHSSTQVAAFRLVPGHFRSSATSSTLARTRTAPSPASPTATARSCPSALALSTASWPPRRRSPARYCTRKTQTWQRAGVWTPGASWTHGPPYQLHDRAPATRQVARLETALHGGAPRAEAARRAVGHTGGGGGRVGAPCGRGRRHPGRRGA